ncbi:TBC1 domain family member 25 isoform X2 [Oratosquilla oratoria]|uniref:TBC1 domain family member 25 isoform X2 n=1 Tax=Oratosquilla oratoria TaxID=337810 RepID=UPI003F76C786
MMEKTLSIVQKAFNWMEETNEDFSRPLRAPLSDSEFHKLLDPVGQVVHPKELRLCVYLGGVEPSLRKVMWKHLLNVYPEGFTGRERMDYIKKKTEEYYQLRATWLQHIEDCEKLSEEVRYITNMVRKDVLRTDRHHPLFSGPDDNENVKALYNILTTYALNHPSVGYCQGMSDLASPLLVTMRDEAQAYVCFCALMMRVHTNFHIDGDAMTLKFQHLTEALLYYDIEFFTYLQAHQADDLLFCYRWLLLELKREFAFDEALHMLEVLWSSLPPDAPKESLPLFEKMFNPVQVEKAPVPPPTPRINHYDNVCALRRKRSSISNRSAECLAAMLSRRAASMDSDCRSVVSEEGVVSGVTKKLSRTWSQPIDSSRIRSRMASGEGGKNVEKIKEEGSVSPEDSPSKNIKKIRNLNEFHRLTKRDSDSDSNPSSPARMKNSPCKMKSKSECKEHLNISNPKPRRCFSDSDTDMGFPLYSDGGEVDVWENPVATLSPDVDQDLQIVCQEEKHSEIELGGIKEDEKVKKGSGNDVPSPTVMVNSCEEVTETGGWQVTVSSDGTLRVSSLPPPEEFGGGNPFLMFLCLTLLLQHREHIMQNNLDHNELAMHFDKMVRKHNVHKVLGQARRMYKNYLNQDFSKYRSQSSPSDNGSSEQSC